MNSQQIRRKNDEFITNSKKKTMNSQRIQRETMKKNAAEKGIKDRNKLSLQRELLIPYYETEKETDFH